MNYKITKCELCGRINLCNEHHLIPRTNHKNKWFKKNFSKEEMNETILICVNDCHYNIHKLISDEKELGKNYNTINKLLSNDLIKNYIDWIEKKETSYSEEDIVNI
jgi:hypothetical protein